MPVDADLVRAMLDAIAYELLELDCHKTMTETGVPNLSAVKTAAGRAARIRSYLCEARDALEGEKEEERESRLLDGELSVDMPLRGRDLYHNRIRSGAKGK